MQLEMHVVHVCVHAVGGVIGDGILTLATVA